MPDWLEVRHAIAFFVLFDNNVWDAALATCYHAMSDSAVCQLTAGTIWRNQRSADLVACAQSLGPGDHEDEIAQLLEQIAVGTDALDQLSSRQQKGECVSPWWADGEYDAQEAERYEIFAVSYILAFF